MRDMSACLPEQFLAVHLPVTDRRMNEMDVCMSVVKVSNSAYVTGRLAHEWREMLACLQKQSLKMPLIVADCAWMRDVCLSAGTVSSSASVCGRLAHEWREMSACLLEHFSDSAFVCDRQEHDF
jgi:hypothetical protein